MVKSSGFQVNLHIVLRGLVMSTLPVICNMIIDSKDNFISNVEETDTFSTQTDILRQSGNKYNKSELLRCS